LHAVRQIGEWSDSTRRIDDLMVEPFRDGSTIHLGGAGERTWFEADTILNEGLLYVLISHVEAGMRSSSGSRRRTEGRCRNGLARPAMA
jgi:hypothetical protein